MNPLPVVRHHLKPQPQVSQSHRPPGQWVLDFCLPAQFGHLSLLSTVLLLLISFDPATELYAGMKDLIVLADSSCVYVVSS